MRRFALAVCFTLFAVLAAYAGFPSSGQVYPTSAGKSLAFQTSVSSSTNASSFTFNAVPIGTATSDRLVYIGVSLPNANTITSATIGGVTATAIASENSTVSAYILGASVTSGTTATIVVNLSGSSTTGVVVGVWTSTGVASLTPHGTNQTATNNTALGVSTLAGGFAMGVTASNGSSACSTTWTNITSAYATGGATNPRCGDGANNTATSGGTTNFTANVADNGFSVMAAAYASF